VQGVMGVPCAFLEQQILSCLSDIRADVIKTGMLGTPCLQQPPLPNFHPMSPPPPLCTQPWNLNPKTRNHELKIQLLNPKL